MDRENAAQGIPESNTLWITHSNFLDDITEIRYISLVLEGIIKLLPRQIFVEKTFDKQLK